MPDFKNAVRPASLKAKPVDAEDQSVLERPAEGCVGTDLNGDNDATQIDCRWHDGKTFVTAMRGAQALQSWTLTCIVRPLDVRAHYLANLSTLKGE